MPVDTHTHRWSNDFPISWTASTVRWFRQCLVPGCDTLESRDARKP